MSHPSGRHFLQIPGPTNVPGQVLRAMAAPTIDHRGPAFQGLALEVLELLCPVFATKGPARGLPGSDRRLGGGAGEHAEPRRHRIRLRTGHFATLWRNGRRLGLVVDFVPGDLADRGRPGVVAQKLAADTARAVKRYVWCTTNLHRGDQPDRRSPPSHRQRRPPGVAVGRRRFLAGCIDYRHDEWGVDGRSPDRRRG